MDTEKTIEWSREMKPQRMKVTNVFMRNKRSRKGVVANVGGADSSKSFSLAQLLITRFFQEQDKGFLVTRKTLPSLRQTAYKLIVDIMKETGYYQYVRHNKSERIISYMNNFMIFTSVDDPVKIKSTEYNYIWMEEANEFTWDDFRILRMRMRRRKREDEVNQIFMSYNPEDENDWTRAKLSPREADFIHSTYKDNPFAQREDIGILEGMASEDDAYHQIYARGQYAKAKGKIFRPLEYVESIPDCEHVIYGLDHGYENPAVLLEVHIDMEARAIYFVQVIYERHLTTEQLIERMGELKVSKSREMFADPSEPGSNEEIFQAGYNVKKADNAVGPGIDVLNRFRPYSLHENVEFNREWNNYKRKQDKAGNIMEAPVKFRDHGPDAARYAAYTYLKDVIMETEPSWVLHGKEAKRGEAGAQEIFEEATKIIDEKGHVPLVIFARSMGMAEETMREKLLGFGFEEHKKGRFIYGPETKAKAPRPEIEEVEKRPEEEESWVVTS